MSQHTYEDAQAVRAIGSLPAPHPDNVEALADAINRFNAKLDEHLRKDQDLTHIFASTILNRASVTIHYGKDGDV